MSQIPRPMWLLVTVVVLAAIPCPCEARTEAASDSPGTQVQKRGPEVRANSPAGLLETIETACTEAEERFAQDVVEAWETPADCQAADGKTVDPGACRKAAEAEWKTVVRDAAEAELQEVRRTLIRAVEAGHFASALELYQEIESALKEVRFEVVDEAELHESADFSSGDVSAVVASGSKSVSSAREGLGSSCRQELAEATHQLLLIQRFREQSEDALYADLQKKDGFSRIVRCQWIRGNNKRDRLDCNPGLRISGLEEGFIRILPPPTARGFRLAWVQAITGEETPSPEISGEPLSCPNYGAKDDRSLACDELCFQEVAAHSSIPERCPAETYRPIETGTAEIAVHLKRAFRTTYGCLGGNLSCAVKSLRGVRRQEHPRAKLSLLSRGSASAISIKAMSVDGRLAEGEVLIGYQRWRVETGGMLAIAWDDAVDQELVTEPVSVDDPSGSEGGTGSQDGSASEGEVKVIDIRDADDFVQETGIFLNLIPANYEWIGASLGFATSDGNAPSVYLGATIRLRTFNNRGLAAFSIGGMMREVDRFPDVKIGEAYAQDSSLLVPDERFDIAPYLSFQLGFSFGPISSPKEDD